MNKKKILILTVLTIFCVGMCLSAVDAASFTVKCTKNKKIGNYRINAYCDSTCGWADAYVSRQYSTPKKLKINYVKVYLKNLRTNKNVVKIYKLSSKQDQIQISVKDWSKYKITKMVVNYSKYKTYKMYNKYKWSNNRCRHVNIV